MSNVLENIAVFYRSLLYSTIGKVDDAMNEVNEQMEHAREIADALANPINVMGSSLDDVSRNHCWRGSFITVWLVQAELEAELEGLQQDVLNERLAEADHVPVHLPPGSKVAESELLQLSSLRAYNVYVSPFMIHRITDTSISDRR